MTALSTQDFWHKITTALAETNPYEKCRLVNQLYDEILPTINLDQTDDFPLVTPEQEIVRYSTQTLPCRSPKCAETFFCHKRRVMRQHYIALLILNLMQ